MVGGIRTCLKVSSVPMDFFKFLSTEFAACSKPPSRDNHRKASYPRTQQRDQGADRTQIKRRLYQKNDAASPTTLAPIL